MSKIRPFSGVRPLPSAADEVVAPPYDVMNEAEARDIARRKPRSIITVTRPEVNLPEGSDSHAPEAYGAAKAALQARIAEGVLVQDGAPCLYFYGQKMGEHRQVALMALCSVEEYDQGLIKKHEFTRPDKEQDRVDHIEGTDTQTGLVFLAYRNDPGLKAAVEAAIPSVSLFTATTDDGVQHTLWKVEDPAVIARLSAAFDAVPALYICDGHHRSAAASRVNAARGGVGPHNWFLAGIFPDDQLQCMAYNRLVKDLRGNSVGGFLAELRTSWTVEPATAPTPPRRGTVTMYLAGQWWLMTPNPSIIPDDPVGSLDVSVLQDNVLAPLLDIKDPRRDTRIDFVGGIRGWKYLQDAVDQGRAAVAFHMYPTGLDQLFATADAGQVMPPKSTWFEPKLCEGMLMAKLG